MHIHSNGSASNSLISTRHLLVSRVHTKEDYAQEKRESRTKEILPLVIVDVKGENMGNRCPYRKSRLHMASPALLAQALA